ncbi:MAG: hypothetical protein WC008_05490 [Bacilli bacterium]
MKSVKITNIMKRPELEKTLKELGYDDAQMADILKAVKDELDPETKPDKDPDEDEEKIEKYKKENDVLKKALEVARLAPQRDTKFDDLSERFEKAISTIESLTESVGELRDINKSLESRIEELGSQPMGPRAMKMSSVIEKSLSGEEILGEDQRLTLSVSNDRQLIEKAMGDIIDGMGESALKTSYEDSLMRLNSAGVSPANEVAQDMFKKGFRLTK